MHEPSPTEYLSHYDDDDRFSLPCHIGTNGPYVRTDNFGTGRRYDPTWSLCEVISYAMMTYAVSRKAHLN